MPISKWINLVYRSFNWTPLINIKTASRYIQDGWISKIIIWLKTSGEMWLSCLIILAHNSSSFRHHKTDRYPWEREGRMAKRHKKSLEYWLYVVMLVVISKGRQPLKSKKSSFQISISKSKLFLNKVDKTNSPLTHRKHTMTCINNWNKAKEPKPRRIFQKNIA